MAKLLGQELSGTRFDRYWLHTGDDGNDRITVETVEDVETIVERNKREFNEAPRSGFKGGMGRKVASIPQTVIEELCRVNKISFRDLMLAKSDRSKAVWNRFLNDPAMRHFRTAPGIINMGRKD